ncbi:F-box protein [Carex littledalei]|uniref:F-box protein n=1 Tax=Carex littledalei TaxID=544730 RepID=A0A833RAJ6_9POAL|nr:F-box protein [Carex littledalei]
MAGPCHFPPPSPSGDFDYCKSGVRTSTRHSHLFSKKLPYISDFIRFRAVCKSWQLSAPVTDPPPQLPWLLEYCEDPENENAILRFYYLSSGKVHSITCPGSRHAWLAGPACRYLLATCSRSFQMYLFNPLTHDQIHVPSGDVRGPPDYIGPDSIEGGDIVIISGHAYDRGCNFPPMMMAFWRSKADDWVYVEGVGDNARAFYKGKYFSNDGDNITNVIDIATKKLSYQVSPPEGTDHLLDGRIIIVESGGKILRLLQHFFRFKGNCIYFLEQEQGLCRYDIGDGATEVLPCPFDSIQTWYSRVKAIFEVHFRILRYEIA